MTSGTKLTKMVKVCKVHVGYYSLNQETGAYIEDITRWQEDMNFMFEWDIVLTTRTKNSYVRASM